MKIRFKKLHPRAVAPTQGTPGSAGFDLTAVSRNFDADHSVWDYGTGLAVEIPEGHVGLVFPRSSIYRTGDILSNGVGVIDSDYRGEIRVILVNLSHEPFTIEPGERIAQMVVARHETVDWEPVDELEESQRGSGGFGSTGKQ